MRLRFDVTFYAADAVDAYAADATTLRFRDARFTPLPLRLPPRPPPGFRRRC